MLDKALSLYIIIYIPQMQRDIMVAFHSHPLR